MRERVCVCELTPLLICNVCVRAQVCGTCIYVVVCMCERQRERDRESSPLLIFNIGERESMGL